jgi:hypothetical protein
LEGKLVGIYACEIICLPEMERKSFLIYAGNPLDALGNASEFTKTYLQGLMARGYTISEVESHEP